MQRIKNIENRVFYIYCLKDPNTLEIRYIGVTCTSLSARLSQHIYDAKKGGTYKRNWLQNLGIKPIIEIIETCTHVNWEERERHWISFYTNLTNTREGGRGVILDRSKESILKSSEAKYTPVIAIDSERNVFTFKSYKEASQKTGVPSSSIEYSITGLNFSSYGYNFIKQSEYSENLRYEVTIRKRKSKYKILHNEIEYTPIEFAKFKNLSETIIYLYCDGKRSWEKSFHYDGFSIQVFKI